LDHWLVIQMNHPDVRSGMESLVQSPAISGAIAAFCLYSQRNTRLRDVGGWRSIMSAEENLPSGPPDWARLIGAVAARGDRRAFAKLFEHFAPRVKTFMRRSGMSDGAAEELAQETLLTVWRKAALFDPGSSGPAAWIFTIARNLRIDALRRDRRTGSSTAGDIEAEFLLDESPHADAVVAARQLDSRVRAALATLPEDQKRVVVLSFHQDIAHADIADQLQIPLGTVKSRLRLAMNKLRAMLEDKL